MIAEWIEAINASSPLMPHGICLAESPGIIAGMIVAHAGIALSYFGIPAVMHLVERRATAKGVDMAAFRVSALYKAFIVLCGFSHLAGIMVLYVAAYQLYLAVLIATMIVSVFTLLAIVKLVNPLVDFLVKIAGPQWDGSTL